MKLYNSFNKQNHSFFKRSTLWAVFFGLTSLASLFSFKTAHAGLVSFINSFLGSGQVSAKTGSVVSSLNSQNIALLQAHASINPTAEMAADLVPIDDGQTLLPDIASSNVIGTDSGSVQISTYVVRSGDTLSAIAKMFNVSVNTIVWANDIPRSAPLQTGQTLVILPVSGITYTVKKGDTVNGIVSRYKADLNEVLRFNDLTVSSKLTPGQTVIIPDAEKAISESNASSQASRGRIKVAPNEPTDVPWWTWPIFTTYFDRPVAIGSISQGLHGHNAVDFAAPVGTPIYASAPGTVIISRSNGGWNGGYGNFVVVSHSNGSQTLYAHMSRTAVSAGSQVARGQIIGYIGMTGLTTGPHVHFEIRGAQNPFR